MIVLNTNFCLSEAKPKSDKPIHNTQAIVLGCFLWRKQGDNDIFNKVSGTMGITGCTDTTIVLEKESRMSDMASLPIP